MTPGSQKVLNGYKRVIIEWLNKVIGCNNILKTFLSENGWLLWGRIQKVISEFAKNILQGEDNNPLSLWKILRIRQRETRSEIVEVIDEKK